MRLALVCFLLIVICRPAAAQYNLYDYYLNNDEAGMLPEGYFQLSDYELFYQPLDDGYDIFTRLSEFNFSAVRYARRGYDSSVADYYFGNIRVSGSLSSDSDYALLANLRRSRLTQSRFNGLASGAAGAFGQGSSFNNVISSVGQVGEISFTGTNRRGKVGLRGRSAGEIMPGLLSHYLAVGGRTGSDGNIRGTAFGDLHISAGLQYKLVPGHDISFFALHTADHRDPRSYATQEAFDLTGDNYYNPSWGHWNGEERNARTKSRSAGLYALNYTGKVSQKTSVEAALSFRHARSRSQGVMWINAANPYPDYYREMPSYTGSAYSEEQWLAGDRSVVQIDWDRMREENLLVAEHYGSGSVYLLENRVEAPRELQAALTARTQADERTRIEYGGRASYEVMSSYKELEDLLGGGRITDRDQYLIGDGLYGDRTLNDVRNPDRLVGEGDRFGYEYNIIRQQAELFASAAYTGERYRFSGALELGYTSYQRDGKYEKELYPGRLSYGKSDKVDFNTYAAKVSAGYSFSPRHMADITLMASARAPEYGNVFISPRYANKIADKPVAVKVLSAEAGYTAVFNHVRARLSGFYTQTGDESAIYSYYDDIASAYSDMVVTGIEKEYYGVELAGAVEFSPRVTFSAAAATGKYSYCNNPDVTIYEDASLEPYVTGAKSYLEKYRVGGTPETVLTAELRYSTWEWTAALTWSYMAGRYIQPTPLRRMERVYNTVNTSPERFSEMVSQEKLDDASTLGLFVMRGFDIGRSRLLVMLSVNNLLGREDVKYGGYEQMRLFRRLNSWETSYLPFPSKYLYSYGRSYYFTITLRL